MRLETYDRKMDGHVDLDVCYACEAIWFDAFESAQLTPGAVMKVFEAIHARGDVQPRPLADVCRCPACRAALKLTHDVQRTNRITYYRCPEGHGRLSTFNQFLLEKNFIRSLTLGEVERLKAVVKQVRCTSCGGAVNLERDPVCPYCRAPIAILDADAVKRTLTELSAGETRRRTVDPHAAIDALLAGQRAGGGERRSRSVFGDGASAWNTDVVDLLAEALGLLNFD